MRYGSVCSGIEAATVAWKPLGWEPAWLTEIMPFPSAVLAHRVPEAPNLGDFTILPEWVLSGHVEAPDVLVGGTPCQAFSIAGSRESLDDERGLLTLKFGELANAIDAVRVGNECVIVWENVPGVLCTDDNAFGHYLGFLAGSGGELFPTDSPKPTSGKSSKFWSWSAKLKKHLSRWGNSGCVYGPQRAIAWRVLDAQYFGLPQRRKRVFLIASARDGFDPAKILFEFDGVRRDSPPSREQGQEVAGSTKSSPHLASGKPCIGTLMANAGTKLWLGNQEAFSGDYAIIPPRRDYKDATDLVVAVNHHSPKLYDAYQHPGWREGDTCGTLTVGQNNTVRGDTPLIQQAQTFGIQGSMIGRSETQDPIIQNNQAFPLGRNQGQENVILFEPRSADGVPRIAADSTLCPTLNTMSGGQREPCVVTTAVRRLTPKECERLQGFPDNWTEVPYRNKSADLCPDGPRYAACGNSMPVDVMRWIGKRIDAQFNNG